MENFPKLLYDFVPKLPRLNLKDFAGFWASDANKDARDLYWKITGEPPTDPMDFMGCYNTTSGEALEEKFSSKWFAKLGPYNCYLYDEQVYLGEVDPVRWSGKLDFLFMSLHNGKPKFYAKEMKTAYGTGGEYILNTMKPKEDQAAQLGLYLRALHNKGKKVENGSLLYFIQGNTAQTRTVMEFLAKYVPEKDEVHFYQIMLPNGPKPFNMVIRMKDIFDNWKLVLDCVEKKELPPAQHYYKYPVTPQLISELKDYQILQAIEGQKVHGDWQVEYSSYKQKHLALSGDKPFYNINEIKMFEEEYRKRHPKTRKF